MNELNWLKRIRNLAGFLGMILPWLALISTFIYGRFNNLPSEFWYNYSISETYYFSPVLAGILTAASVVLICYKGYDWRDELITTISGIFGLIIVLFPCTSVLESGRVGLFQLDMKISDIIHCSAASIFFILLAINSFFLFTLGDSNTKQKKKRNLIYRICGIGMAISTLLIFLPIPGKIFITEAVALTFFGISWLVKGEVFNILSDK